MTGSNVWNWGESKSSLQLVTSSVPQGMVIDRLLFVIYITDLPDGLRNNWEMYTDDNKVLARNEDEQDNGLQQNI